MARLQFCDYHNMVAILEKGEFNTDFHHMVDFIAAPPLRYALTIKPIVFVSHIRQFWSTTRIETTDERTHILATVDGIQKTVSEASLRRNLKLRDEDGIVSIPDTELFENLTQMGPKIEDTDNFELKGQFLKELLDNIFSGLDHEDADEHIEKVLEILYKQLNNLGREIKKVNEKVYATQVECEQCKGPHYTKDGPLKEEGKTLEESYYTQFVAPFQGEGYRASALGFYPRNNANSSKEKDLGSFTLPLFIKNVCFDNALAELGASVSVMPLLTYFNLGLGELAHTKLTGEVADKIVKYPKGIAKNVLVGIGKFVFPVDFIIL
uniref:Uncharacterized protein n=1 Tax=Tanacetum cinerariifolium TaxID=118510 RepID=A0A6L2P4A4_TANCI|nr:hypothetical protein [Tanacetum cinerariifolium]